MYSGSKGAQKHHLYSRKCFRQRKSVSYLCISLFILSPGKQTTADKFSRAFRAKINPADNQAAEQELQREIK